MIVLGIETSGRTGSVALGTPDGMLAQHTFPEGARHARDIVPAIARITSQAGVSREDIDGVAVSEGPGSFNGLRIGVACARMLAFALGWRCVGIPSLEVKAWNVEPDRADTVCPVLDARRDRVYGTVFTWDGAWRDRTGVMCLAPDELAASVPDGALVFGDALHAYPEAFAGDRVRKGPADLRTGRAEVVVRLGLRRFEAGGAVDPMCLVPKYHRLTQPEEKLAGGWPTG
jgi:tRNA threonylcarbamoyladenosine biosynthesis protein TsaB